MITFTILVMTILALVVATAILIFTGGAAVVLALGDFIVCGLIIWGIVWIVRKLRKK